MRPDKSDAIVLPSNFIWRGLPVDVIVPIGSRPKKKALEWLIQFSSANKRPLLYQIGDEWFAFGPPAFQTEMSERIRRSETFWAE